MSAKEIASTDEAADEAGASGAVTRALRDLRRGRAGAGDDLFRQVHAELRRIAGACMRGERRAHTLQPTALVNEAYLRLMGRGSAGWEDSRHFLASAARAMRRILVDHARAHNARKRGGDRQRITLGEGPRAQETLPDQVLAVHEALERLASIDAVRAHVVELRYFGGLTVAETAQVTGVSERTVKRAWEHARLWLYRELAP